MVRNRQMMKDAYTKVRNMGYLLHSVDFVPLTALPVSRSLKEIIARDNP
jgi:hypothetical protein